MLDVNRRPTMGEFNHILKNVLLLFGRIFIALIFIISGISKLTHFGSYAHLLGQHGMPYTEWLLGTAVAFELIGGLSVLLGYKIRFGALLLLIFILPATFIFHSFWDYQPLHSENQVHHFLKNICMFGGLLYVYACGAGCYSLDHRQLASSDEIT
jgi:putative oxidoreductase